MRGTTLRLSSTWIVGDRVGGGGFGDVYALTGGSVPAVAKFVPKRPGAEREMLFVEGLKGVRNVVPVIDSGQLDGHWVLVMPRAAKSLRQHLDEHAGASGLDLDDALRVLVDVATALVDLDGSVVHRDIKPQNILLLDSHWCLADFGISRYAEASTATHTHKHAMSAPYAAPERWRSERATIAADVYALGVMAYEMLTRQLPFQGPSIEDLRWQHLHANADPINEVPAGLASLIDECLFKAPVTRPTPANLLARLSKQQSTPQSAALAALADANRDEVRRRSEVDAQASRAMTEAEQRADRQKASRVILARISAILHEAIMAAAPAAASTARRRDGWSIKLGSATLTFSNATERSFDWGGWPPPAFNVDSVANLNLKIPPTSAQYEGRSHSLWFGDIREAGQYAWFETAFMVAGLIPYRGVQDPFSLDPGEKSAKAVWKGMAEYQVAWPFTRLDSDDLDDFVERWAGWLAAAASGQLQHPSQMPERPAEQSWRT